MTFAPDPRLPTAFRKPGIALWFAFLTALAGIAAYYDILTGFSTWDDEGMLLLSVKQYVGGMKLYDQSFQHIWAYLLFLQLDSASRNAYACNSRCQPNQHFNSLVADRFGLRVDRSANYGVGPSRIHRASVHVLHFVFL